jgi:hypothetical protein
MSDSQCSILPGTNHTTIVERVDWLVSIVTCFLDAGAPV